MVRFRKPATPGTLEFTLYKDRVRIDYPTLFEIRTARKFEEALAFSKPNRNAREWRSNLEFARLLKYSRCRHSKRDRLYFEGDRVQIRRPPPPDVDKVCKPASTDLILYFS